MLGVELGLATVFLIKIKNRGYDLFLNIGKKRGNKRISDCPDSFGYPLVKMKEFSFTGENSKTDGEMIIIPVGESDEGIFDVLCDIKDSGEI